MHTYSGADKVLRSDIDADCFDMRLDYGPLDSVVHLIVCIMLLWSFFEVGSCLGGSVCSVWILVVFLFFGWFCCTCFLFLLVSLLVVAWLAVCVSLCMCLCVCVYVGVFT